MSDKETAPASLFRDPPAAGSEILFSGADPPLESDCLPALRRYLESRFGLGFHSEAVGHPMARALATVTLMSVTLMRST